MANSFYFYDLETSGINPRESRVMQFAGQRTDLDLQVIGEADNILITMSEDILPDPEAILVTGITPQQTQTEGISEATFLKKFDTEIATPGTIFVGYNTVRFDDEFMRCLLYRNFYDPYAWQWQNDRSRWDLLDVVRLTRALRPAGISWPVDEQGIATNRLELITKQNGIDHQKAHDALNDVYATIALAKLLKTKQPKLFDYLLSMRDKRLVEKLVNLGQPFVYASGKYPSEYQKTTVAVQIAPHPKRGGAIVYDLRQDPKQFAGMSVDELVEAWKWKKPEDRIPSEPRLPVKVLAFNKCPAVAPLGVLSSDTESQARLQISMDDIQKNWQNLRSIKQWPDKILEALSRIESENQKKFVDDNQHVDSQLYDNLINQHDQSLLPTIRKASPNRLSDFINQCQDVRLKKLLPLYKARNYPHVLTAEERSAWEEYKHQQLLAGGVNSKMAQYFEKLHILSSKPDITPRQKNILEDLYLYGQSTMPIED